MKRILLLLIIAYIGSITLCAQAIEHMLEVSVEGIPITANDIKQRSQLIITSSGLPNNQKSYQMLYDKIFDMLIDELLVAREMQRLNIEVSEIEIDEAFMTLAEKNGVPHHKIMEVFKKRGMDVNELKKQLKYQVGWAKIITQYIKPSVNISEREISESRSGIERAAKSASMVVEMKLAEIVLFYHKESDLSKQQAFAQKLLYQIHDGANFATLAREFSQSQSAASYGEIGWVSSSQMPTEIAKRLVKVGVGGVSMMELPDGIHIFKILDRKVISSTDEVIGDEEIKNFLMQKKLELEIKTYLKKMRRNAHIQQYQNAK